MTSDIARRFNRSYGDKPRLFWAPGRVNLIGDHIDYCGGPVLPMPIQFGTTVAMRLRDDGRVRGRSQNDEDVVDFRLDESAVLPVGHWGHFLRGAIGVLRDHGIAIGGVDVVVAGDIPGSGLSSSASLSVGLLYALSQLFVRPLASIQLAQLGQCIEHQYVGVQCGLMDQAVIALAQPGCALWFDCSDYRHRPVPVPAAGPSVVVMNTGRVRQLVGSAYNKRLMETRTAASALGIEQTGLAHLDPESFNALQVAIDAPIVRRRARHVVSEAARVASATEALESRDWAALGRLFCASHTSLRDDYQVSCPELDVLVDAFAADPRCYGARMTGAGFGGSVVALVQPEAVPEVTSRVERIYERRFGLSPSWFTARSLGGVKEIYD